MELELGVGLDVVLGAGGVEMDVEMVLGMGNGNLSMRVDPDLALKSDKKVDPDLALNFDKKMDPGRTSSTRITPGVKAKARVLSGSSLFRKKLSMADRQLHNPVFGLLLFRTRF